MKSIFFLSLLSFCLFSICVQGQNKPITVYPFQFSYLQNESSDWLNILGDKLNNTEIIGLGEVTHGTMETFRIKNKLIQYLIEKKGFRMLILEYADPQLRVLDNYLSDNSRNDPKSLDSLYNKTFSSSGQRSTLNNTDFRELFIWLKGYNLNHPQDMVSFRGMDISVEWGTFWNGWMNESSKKSIRDVYGRRDLTLDESKDVISNWYQLEKQKFKDSLNEKSFHLLEMDVRNYMEYFKYIKNGENNNISMIRLRDSLMSENIMQIKNKKAIIHAHNLHVSNSGFSAAQWNAKMLGNYLRDRYGEKYYIILTDFSVSADVNIFSKPHNFSVKTFQSNPKTLSYILNNKFNISEGLVFDEDLQSMGDIKLNNIGLTGDRLLISAPPKSFNALIFFKNLSPSLLR